MVFFNGNGIRIIFKKLLNVTAVYVAPSIRLLLLSNSEIPNYGSLMNATREPKLETES